MRKETEAKWAERIRQWRESGLPAEQFAEGKDYKASSLLWAASLIHREKGTESTTDSSSISKTPRHRRRAERRPLSPSEMPRFLPVHTRGSAAVVTDIVIEIGGARIRVPRGTDLSLLGDVVRALQGVGR